MVPMETTVLQLTVPPEMQGELLGAVVRWGWVHLHRTVADGNHSGDVQLANYHQWWSGQVSADFSGIGTASPVPTSVDNPTGRGSVPFRTRRSHGIEIRIKLK